MSGFIAIHRSLWENDVFPKAPMSEREAWIWMIAKAAWKPTKHRVGNKVSEVPRGSFFTTLRELQKAFRWKSDKRVRGFLTMLENERMIGRKTDAGKTQITICNYDKYQEAGRATDARRTQDGRKTDALKNKDNKETKKQDNSAQARPDDVDEAVWDDFLTLRKQQRAPVTPTALAGLRREAEKAGWPLSRALAECAQRGWRGFKADWVANKNSGPVVPV